MTSYRLFLWSRGENRLRERHVVTDAGGDGDGLLDTFDRIGRCALIAEDRLPAADPIVPEPQAPARLGKLARARRHLLVARRLLEDMGETVLAARAAAPLDELDRRGLDRRRKARDGACLLPRLPA